LKVTRVALEKQYCPATPWTRQHMNLCSLVLNRLTFIASRPKACQMKLDFLRSWQVGHNPGQVRFGTMVFASKNFVLHDSWQSADPQHSHAPPTLSSVQPRETRIDINRQKKTVFLLQAEQQIVLRFCENQQIAPLPRKNDSTDFLVELFR
jgi:hypothetical protein